MTEETTPQETPTREAPAKKTPHMRPWVFWLRAAFVVCLLPLVFLAAAAVMIIERDITAPSWVTQQIEDRAAEVLDGVTLDFGEITMRIGRDLHPTVRLIDTRLVDEGGLTLTRVPVVEGLISPRGLILQQDVLMQEVRLVGAQVNLRRAADGDVSLAFAATGDDLGRARNLPELLDQFDQVFERPALEALEIVRAQGLILNFDDARAGRSWIIDGGSVTLDLRGRQTLLRGDFALLSGRADVTTVAVSYNSPRGSRTAQVGLNMTNAVASDLATQSPALSWLRDISAPITASLRTSLDAEGALGPVNAALEMGAGVLRPNPATAPLEFNGANAYFAYDPVRDRLSFTEVILDTDWGTFAAEGDAYLREFRNGLPRALLAQLRFSDIAIAPPGFFDTPPRLESASADLRFRFDPFAVELGELVVMDGDTRMIATGAARATDAGWDVALDAEIDQMTPERFVDFWPNGIKPGSRQWFTERVTGGDLHNLVAGIRILPERAPQTAVGFEFRDNTVQYMRSMPAIREATGVASIIDHQFVVSLDRGVMIPPQGGPVVVDGSSFTMVDMRQNPSPALLQLTADSTVTAALSVINQPPFRYIDRAGLDVTLADGRALTTGEIRWPLEPRPDPDAITMDFEATLSRVRSETLVPGRTLAAPRLGLTASREGVRIEGPVQIGAVTATGAWEQRFGDPERPGSRVDATVALSETFLDEFNIALPPQTITGRGNGQLSLLLGQGGPPAFSLTSDLIGLRVALPPVGWAKAQQTTGNLLVEGTLGGVPEITALQVGGGGLQATGRVQLDDGGGLDAATFSTVRIGNWLNAPITLRGRGAGQAPAVEISGGSLDLRQAAFGAGGGDGGPVTLRLDRLQITEGIAFTDFRGDFRSDGGFRGEFTAQLNGAAAVEGAVAPRNGRSAVRVRSADAGRVLRAAGLMENALGGAIDLTLLPAGGAGTFDGALSLRDLRVRDAPAIAALLDAVSVVGLLQQLDGQGLAFEEVDARFRLTPEQIILTEASAVGPGLGISADGFYTLATKQIDLQGVVSPFFLVNSIGSFLTRRGEGLIGFNYTIGGTSDAPEVGVNPLSVLTPGMFREIFRRPPPGATQ
ncbi:MAG: AsmA-like C-terminal region-containing protein [Pseudomonadota bacterium]